MTQMTDRSYEGFYTRFDTPSKDVGALLMGADDLVGDDYQLELRSEGGRPTVWLKNKFGEERGFLDKEASRRVQLALGRGQKVRALLSFVAFSDTPDPGIYWGQMAIFCFNPAYSLEMDGFIDRIALKMADGLRPQIDLKGNGVQRIFSEESWVPTDTVPLPKKARGTAMVKNHRSLTEKMVEQGRARNKGCYAISWLLIIVIGVGIVAGVLKLMGVLP